VTFHRVTEAAARKESTDDDAVLVSARSSRRSGDVAGADPVADSLQHSGLDEPTKPVGEHVAADAETCLELFETAPPQEGVPDEEQAPALADHL
jgi:hypothetical protein